MKKFAYVDFGGEVIGIESRCSHFLKADCVEGELSIEDIVHPDFMHRYVEIPAELEVTCGMFYLDGVFSEIPQTKVEQIQQQAIDSYTTQLIEGGLI